MGKFNASVGSQSLDEWFLDLDCVGFGLGNRNARGERLVEFCEQYDLIVTNTMYEVPKRRRYTCKAPGDRARYQID